MSAEADCIFCKIARGDIPSKLVYEDDRCVAFRDQNPQAPVHVLLIPRQHWTSLADLPDGDETSPGHLLRMARKVATNENLAENGYRVVINTGKYGGQTVPHLHLHVLGGRALRWPPG